MKVTIAAAAPQPTGTEAEPAVKKETAVPSAFAALLAQMQTGKLPVEEGIEQPSEPEDKKPRRADERTELLWTAVSTMHVGATDLLNGPPAAVHNSGEALAFAGGNEGMSEGDAKVKTLPAVQHVFQQMDEHSGEAGAGWPSKQAEGAGKGIFGRSNGENQWFASHSPSPFGDAGRESARPIPFSAAGRSPFASTAYGSSALPHREDARQLLHGHALVSANHAPFSLTSFVPVGHEMGGMEARNESSFVEQVARALQLGRWMKLPSGAMQLVIRLHPEHLGTVTVKMAQESGKLTAKLLVATDAAEQLIRTHLPQLVQLLDASQVTVEKWTIWSDYDGAAPPYSEHRRDGRQQSGSKQEQKREQSPPSSPFGLDGVEVDG
ncbi:hypothetical protein M493_06220 [Geobacillus genomosp. 3]|uniref:Flagellar hook-length control protein-like C-terminal domain-containing protein n=1 Tax=Geobacillus genomosp. 3 TaxID=1921421 RepID=S5ZBM4_GEOG3|nr:flagellar hook-length control protein FliK [Geobacillus genomosp. 3]AGT31540.1 hypothetical protein M493_06220 [Geobacillus genomosp. 3]